MFHEDDMRRLLLAMILCLLPGLALAADDVGLGNDRLSQIQFVRDLTGERTTTYVGDTTIARLLYFAQIETKVALGSVTSDPDGDFDIDTIVTTANIVSYKLRSDHMHGRVSLIIHRAKTTSGMDVGAERIMHRLPLTALRETGEDAPWSYGVKGHHVILGSSPFGGDTLFVYGTVDPTKLLATDSTFSLPIEDEPALGLLTAAWVVLYDNQIQLSQIYYQMWQNHVRMRREDAVPQGVQGQ